MLLLIKTQMINARITKERFNYPKTMTMESINQYAMFLYLVVISKIFLDIRNSNSK